MTSTKVNNNITYSNMETSSFAHSKTNVSLSLINSKISCFIHGSDRCFKRTFFTGTTLLMTPAKSPWKADQALPTSSQFIIFGESHRGSFFICSASAVHVLSLYMWVDTASIYWSWDYLTGL